MLLRQERDPVGFGRYIASVRNQIRTKRLRRDAILLAIPLLALGLVLAKRAEARLLEIERQNDGSGYRICAYLGPIGYCWYGVQLPSMPPPPQYPQSPTPIQRGSM